MEQMTLFDYYKQKTCRNCKYNKYSTTKRRCGRKVKKGRVFECSD